MIQIAQLFLSLTILITLHEFGHFYFAKKFKTRVEKFYLFFDFLFPFAGLLNFAIFKKKIGETEYGLGWFPFGGYVQIAGMVDEQMDKSQTQGEPQPWELRSKPAWQRLLIMMGGIIVNLILGVLIYWMLMFFVGRERLYNSDVKNGIVCDSLALRMGFQNGDKFIALDNVPVKFFNTIPVDMVMNKAKVVTVERNGKEVAVNIAEDDLGIMLKRMKKSRVFSPRFPCFVDSTYGEAKKAGLQKGDQVIRINNSEALFFDEVVSTLRENKGKEVDVTVLRNKDTLTRKIAVDTAGRIGFAVDNDLTKFFKLVEEKYSFFAALPEGIKEAYEKLVLQVKSIVVIFTVKDAYTQVGGFYTMANSLPTEWDWATFWNFTAFLSVMLAFMNFLPVPMLDGGYIMFILFEMIFRTKVPDKVIYYANYVGLVLILGLMIYANTDFLRN
ncbi:MAG: RIP metalloprotease RseP [Bacteroidia bacterium]